jgi:uncharacterized coiled-coil protein SlyX
VLLQLDALSKLNAALNEQNTQLEAEKERLRICNEELSQ